jgi:hypothetical protein
MTTTTIDISARVSSSMITRRGTLCCSYAYDVDSAFCTWEKVGILLQTYREMQEEWT